MSTADDIAVVMLLRLLAQRGWTVEFSLISAEWMVEISKSRYVDDGFYETREMSGSHTSLRHALTRLEAKARGW